MPNDYLDKVTLNGTTYDIKDTVSGYTSNIGTVTGVKINTTTKSPDVSGTVDLGTVVTSETDPTVPAWAKASNKPTYTASEVGAVPTSRTVNGKALSSNITLSASDVGALPDSTTIPTVVNTYSSTGTDAISGKGVSAALGTLDSSIAATTGQAISAITISNGKITGSTKISVGDANQNAFSNIKIGNSTIAADTTTDTVELVAGGLVSLTADTTNDKVTISASYTVSAADVTSALGYSPAGKDVASSFGNGLMSSSDKIKLDGLSPTGQVQADWNVSDSTSGAFIRNKPTDLGDFANVNGGYYNRSSDMSYALVEHTGASQYVMTVSGSNVTLSDTNIIVLYLTAASALKQLFYYVDFQTGEAHVFEIVRFNVTSISPLTVVSVELTSYHNGVLETIVLADDPNVNGQMIGTLSTKTIPTNVSDLTNDAGYLTQSTLGSALQANTALIYELVYHEAVWDFGSQVTPAHYTIADTLANVVANISSDRKVVFRQSLNTGKYNYWQPWFNNPNSDKIGLYRFEKDDGKLYHVVFEPDSQGTGLTGIEVEPYYLNQYNPYAVGKIITTSSISDNPNNYLSGSWTLIDKEFINRNRYDVTSAVVSANTTNTNSVSLIASRMGHDIYLQLTVNNKVAISTTNLELFTLKTSGNVPTGLNALGLSTRIDVSYFYFLGYCDNANAAAMMDIDYSGRVRSLNVLTRGNATSIAAGNTITATFTLHNPPEYMLDSYCDKFYWRRDS